MTIQGKDSFRDIGRTRSGLRLGYTTGSCAAAASKAAAVMLLSGTEIDQVRLMTPKGILLYLDVEEKSHQEGRVRCGVRKFSGDDPDVTDGTLVFAQVERLTDRQEALISERTDLFCSRKDRIRLFLDGGTGVGRVRERGLEQSVGQPAINKVPRQMIFQEVEEVCRSQKAEGAFLITISIPEGIRLAEKTFNPRLGIEGGLSVLGTSGIVEPMSEKALTDTIYLEMKMLRSKGFEYCYVVPGNYGTTFLSEEMSGVEELSVKCSNYVGEAIDYGALLGMKGLLLVGHIGKFVKLAAGVMNTHSRQADCRMEVLAAHAAMANAAPRTVQRIMKCLNTTEAVSLLREENILEPVMDSVAEKIRYHIRRRAGDALEAEAIVFSNEDGILCMTQGARSLLSRLEEMQDKLRE